MTFRAFHFLFFFSFCLLLNSCDNNRVFESYAPVPQEGWHKDSLLNYTLSIKDTSLNHNLYFNIRNSIDYSYSNIWLFVSITPPQGTTYTDTIEFSLASQSGKWFGKGHGKFRDNQLEYRKNIFFPTAGDFKFEIQHGMRKELLTGINDVGIRVEQVK
jgi:gliding motility-associated lipoprotein GldH